jgi:biopolymer transport protein ExbB/TolQ
MYLALNIIQLILVIAGFAQFQHLIRRIERNETKFESVESKLESVEKKLEQAFERREDQAREMREFLRNRDKAA